MGFVQTTTTTGATPPLTTSAFGSSTTTGNLIAVAISDDSGTNSDITGVTDNKGNAYSPILAQLNTGVTLTIYYAQNITGGSGHTVTVAGSGFGANYGVVAQEYSSIASSALDVSVSATGTSTSPASGSTATTTQANELVVGATAFEGSPSAPTLGSSYTNLGSALRTGANVGVESKTVSSTGTQSAAFTIPSAAWVCACVTFKAVAPAGSMPTFTDLTVPVAANFNALRTGIVNLSTYTLGAYATGLKPPRNYIPHVRVWVAAQQTISSASYTAVNWNRVDVDNDNMFSMQLPGQVTIRTAGTWALRAEWRWDATAAGDRMMVITYNGNTFASNAISVSAQHYFRQLTDGPVLHASTLLPGCAAGAPVAVTVFQDSGTTAQNSNTMPNSYLEMWLVGP